MNRIVELANVCLFLQLATDMAYKRQIHNAIREQFRDLPASGCVLHVCRQGELIHFRSMPNGICGQNLKNASQTEKQSGQLRPVERKALQLPQIPLSSVLRHAGLKVVAYGMLGTTALIEMAI